MNKNSQNGSALFVSLVVITLLLMLGASTMTTSVVDLRVSGITKRAMDGFQKAEAGVNGVMSLVDTTADPFRGKSNSNPLAGLTVSTTPTNPLVDVSDVSVSTTLTQAAGTCSRNVNGFSANKIACEYYEINSVHSEPNTAITTPVTQGIRREVIAN